MSRQADLFAPPSEPEPAPASEPAPAFAPDAPPPPRTTHRLRVGDARDLADVADASVHLVVTSPPYPMVAMWDAAFAAMSAEAAEALAREDGPAAFAAMHRELDRAWAEVARVLVPGGFACINVGDATRTVGGVFRLYPNHARIVSAMADLGLDVLPDVLWRKPTNAPNKFMGSGMLPAGAYVTYEHEYVLIFRKGPPRRFRDAEARAARARSAFFWEERNAWFSDVWQDLPGTRQKLGRAGRERSGAFPLELPYRLCCMFSLEGEVVLDPFAGTGTTGAAALAAGRSSVQVERDPSLLDHQRAALDAAVAEGRARAAGRLAAHRAFVAARAAAGKPPKHRHDRLGVPVVTRQETRLRLLAPRSLAWTDGEAAVEAVAEHVEAR